MIKKENGSIGIIILVILIFIALAIAVVAMWYSSSLKAVQKDSQKVTVIIEDGIGVSGIADTLEKNGVIQSATTFKIYCKINNKTKMQAGKYELDKNMSVDQIITKLEKGSIIDESVTITFIEGKNMRWIAKTIAEKTENSEDDVFELLKNDEYIDSLIDKYWFLTDKIKDDDIYYPLEGYLYPDTYTFENKSVDVKTIFKNMLDAMNSQLSPYKEEIENSKYSIHELLTLASIVELEALNAQDRASVAGVFYNRLKMGMALQSDVTTYYALQIDMGDRDLSNSDLNTKNAYNTRASDMAGKLPIGPICSVNISSIKASIEPKNSDNLFFVADKNGKVYYSRTNSEHEKITAELKEKGLWITY